MLHRPTGVVVLVLVGRRVLDVLRGGGDATRLGVMAHVAGESKVYKQIISTQYQALKFLECVNCENHGLPGVNLHRPTLAF